MGFRGASLGIDWERGVYLVGFKGSTTSKVLERVRVGVMALGIAGTGGGERGRGGGASTLVLDLGLVCTGCFGGCGKPFGAISVRGEIGRYGS